MKKRRCGFCSKKEEGLSFNGYCLHFNINKCEHLYKSRFINKKKESNVMKKSDLKTGMFIIFENSFVARVYRDTSYGDFIVFYTNERRHIEFFTLSENLDMWNVIGWVVHVKKVFETKLMDLFNEHYHYLAPSDGKIIWERKEKHTIAIDGVKKEISDESYKAFKELLEGME
jgi:hypothetical protein